MISIYETTGQGVKTRSHLLNHINLGEELSREDLIQRSGLTYNQVRRQTKNLSIQGVLRSRTQAGKRLYTRISVSVIVVTLAWSVPVTLMSSDTDDHHETIPCLITAS